jgi:tetratricopeptide (TPR) repeat protein
VASRAAATAADLDSGGGAAEALLGRAETLYALQRPADALETYHAVLQREPQSADVHFRQAKAFFATGRPDAGLRSLRTALNLDDDLRADLQRLYPELADDPHARRRLGLD